MAHTVSLISTQLPITALGANIPLAPIRVRATAVHVPSSHLANPDMESGSAGLQSLSD
jgi:hypothetical protein